MTVQPLPQGLSLVAQQRIRNFKFNLRNTDTVSGDASLHGLYGTSSEDSDSGQGTPTVVRKVIPTPFSKPDPDQDERKKFANHCMFLPEILQNAGYNVLNAQVEQFYKAAEKQVANLQRNVGKNINPDQIRQIEDKVNQFAVKCYELKIQCVRVTRDNLKGSHKRSDGLYSKTTVMRTLYLNKPISEEDILRLILSLMSEETVGTTTVAQYRIKESRSNSIYLEAEANRTLNSMNLFK